MGWLHNRLLQMGLDLSPANIISKPEFSHSFFLGSGQVVVSLLAFLMTYVLANHVAEEVLGQYRFILALYASLSVLALGGLTTALTQSVASGRIGAYKQAISIKWRYGLLVSLLFVISAIYYSVFESSYVLAVGIFVAGMCLPAVESFNLYSAYLNGVANFKRLSYSLIVSRAVTAVVVIGIAVFVPKLTYLIGGYFLSQIVTAYVFHKKISNDINDNESTDDGMVSYGKHMTAMALLSVLSSQLDKIVLFVFFGPVSLASFWVASVLPQEVGRAVSLVVSAFFPRMVKVSKAEAVRTVKKIFVITLFSGIFLSILYYYLSPLLFDILLPKYRNYVLMSSVLMVAYAVVPHLFVWNIFTAKKMVKELYWYSIVEPSLTIALYLVFIPIWGVWGLVWALCLKNILLNLAAVVVMNKYLTYEK